MYHLVATAMWLMSTFLGLFHIGGSQAMGVPKTMRALKYFNFWWFDTPIYWIVPCTCCEPGMRVKTLVHIPKREYYSAVEKLPDRTKKRGPFCEPHAG